MAVSEQARKESREPPDFRMLVNVENRVAWDFGHRLWVVSVVRADGREESTMPALLMCRADSGAWQQGARKGRGRLTGLEKWCKERPSNSGAIAWRRFSAGEAPKYGPRWKGWVLRDVAPWPDGPDRIDDAADAL